MSEILLLAVAQGSAPPGGVGGILNGIAPMLIILGIFYFLIMRPQMKRQKAHQAMLSHLKKGDEVITNGGLVGKVVLVETGVLTLEIADRVKVKVMRNQIAGLRGQAEAAPAKA